MAEPAVVRRSSERTLEVAGRDWPAQFHNGDVDLPGISHYRRQARVMFEGGEVSVVWGSATYSTNHDHDFTDQPFVEEPTLVEVGMWGQDGALVVLAYVPASFLGEMLVWLAEGGSVETLVEMWKETGGMLG